MLRILVKTNNVNYATRTALPSRISAAAALVTSQTELLRASILYRRMNTNTMDASVPTETSFLIDDTSAVAATVADQRNQQRRKQQQLYHPLYPKLFTSYQLNGIDGPDGLLPNRLLMGSMHTGLEGHSMPSLFEKFLNIVDNEDADRQPRSHTLDRMATYFQRRAVGGVGLMVTGGIAPNREGWVGPFSAQLTNSNEMELHKVVTGAVRGVDVPVYRGDCSSSNENVTVVPSKIVLQILHSGRYGYHPFAVSAENGKSPISPFKAKMLSTKDVQRTVSDFVRTAEFAKQAGYNGVEIMGSEGYLLSQFLSPRTNSKQRTDIYGGPSFENRSRFPLDIVKQVRQACGSDFIIIFRISLWELVDNGMSFEEAVELAKLLKNAGVTILNTGIGWHESRIPTIATNVPRGAFVSPTKLLKEELTKEFDSNEIPAIVSTNRINAPDTAELILDNDTSDLISMARPFLSDPDFVNKARNQQPETINTCIACNQACLDHAFVGKTASCLVNPAACHETELDLQTIASTSAASKRISYENDNTQKTSYVLPMEDRLNLGVIGAGPAGIAFACTAAELGHNVTLYDRASKVGGQFHMAKRVPGKEEFYEAIRYWESRLAQSDLPGTINVKLNTDVSAQNMSKLSMKSTDETGPTKVDKWIVSTGVYPRDPKIPGSENHPDRILSYIDVLRHNKPVGKRVAVIGAGGIGFDVSEFLIYNKADDDKNNKGNSCPAASMSIEEFWREWGVDPEQEHRGGLLKDSIQHKPNNDRLIYLMQRKKGKLGAGLGRTTGWIHRASLKHSNQVTNISGVKSYDKIDDDGNLIYTDQNDKQQVLCVDTVVLCAGQIEERTLENESKKYPELHNKVYPIGGAYKAGELDAKRAIDMGTRLAHKIHLNDVVPGKHVFKSLVGTEEKLFRFLQKFS